jgi:hypothetical protein
MKYISIIFEAAKAVFKNKNYVFVMFVLTVIFFFTIILIPVQIVPGNDLRFQLSIMPKLDLVVIMLVSLFTATSLTFNLYLLKRNSNSHPNRLGSIAVSSFAGITSSFFGSVTCVACAATVLGLLGVGTVAFIYQYRPFLALISISVLTTSLYLTSKQVLYLCDSCHVKAQ